MTKPTRGRKPLGEQKLRTVTLRLLHREIEQISVNASKLGITDGEWKRRAIRLALLEPNT